MRRVRRFSGRWLWATAALGLSGPLCALANASPANTEVKAVMIYNLIRFMTLPEAHAHVRLCVKAGEDINAHLSALSGQPVGNGVLEVEALPSLADSGHGCDVIYAGAAPHSPAHGQITIGEGAAFAQNGGTVALISFGGQLRFIINAAAARHAGVAVNSQLMRLAARVVN